jgi:hypothetical protein
MLRLVSRFLRALLVLVAAILLAWLPVSFFVYTYVMFSWFLGASVSSGSVWVWQQKGPTPYMYEPEFLSYEAASENSLEAAALPAYERRQVMTTLGPREDVDLRLPLWLLAAICLAWPVTSLLLTRRRRKGRGFEIEVRDQKSEVSQRTEDVADGPSDL